MEINQCMTQDTIEPRHNAFFLCGCVISLHRLQQALLHKVSRQFGIARALAHEANERIKLSQNGRDIHEAVTLRRTI